MLKELSLRNKKLAQTFFKAMSNLSSVNKALMSKNARSKKGNRDDV